MKISFKRKDRGDEIGTPEKLFPEIERVTICDQKFYPGLFTLKVYRLFSDS